MGDTAKIDEIDVIILKSLLKNARTPYTDIARECGISGNSIRIRVDRLKEKGVITGAITQVNPKSLGYDYIAFLRIQASANKIRSVYDFLKNTPNMINMFQEMGSYNFMVIVALKRIQNIDNVIAYIKRNPDVITVSANIAWDLVFVDHPENLEIEAYEENQLDETDIEIAKILANNARISFRKIAKQLDISTKKVIDRYEKMKDLLPHSTITLNLKKLGFTAQAVFLIKTSHKNELDEIFKKIVQVKNVIVAIKHYGPYEITVVVPFKSFEQLYEIYGEIAKIEGIEELNTHVNEPFHEWPLHIFAHLL